MGILWADYPVRKIFVRMKESHGWWSCLLTIFVTFMKISYFPVIHSLCFSSFNDTNVCFFARLCVCHGLLSGMVFDKVNKCSGLHVGRTRTLKGISSSFVTQFAFETSRKKCHFFKQFFEKNIQAYYMLGKYLFG